MPRIRIRCYLTHPPLASCVSTWEFVAPLRDEGVAHLALRVCTANNAHAYKGWFTERFLALKREDAVERDCEVQRWR